MTLLEAIRQVLKEQRHFLGYSRPQLSERSGIAESTIGRIEGSGGDVYISTLQKLANGLQMDLSEFLEEVEQKMEQPAVKSPRTLAKRHMEKARYWMDQV